MLELQSGGCATIHALGPQAILREWTYKRRSSELYLFVDGVEREKGSILVALGLVEGNDPVDIPEPPPPSSHFADLLSEAGLTGGAE